MTRRGNGRFFLSTVVLPTGMQAQLISGKAIGSGICTELRTHIERESALKNSQPRLDVVLVGNDAASQTYVRIKERRCATLGIRSKTHRLPTSITETELLHLIDGLNNDSDVHGILVQLPLPDSISKERVQTAIAPHKDVDGFHPLNAAGLITGTPLFVPCTPAGCMRLIESTGVEIAGAHAVVVGRSTIVGRPMSHLLLRAHATVTTCHRHTRNLGALTRQADILVVAIGQPGFIDKTMIKSGAVVIDVGITRVSTPSGSRLAGDVHNDGAEVAGFITPVPGGVGPMTIAMLMHNTVKAWLAQ